MSLCLRVVLLSVIMAAFVTTYPEVRLDDRPRVLLIGDSISQGYTKFVQEQLADEAEVLRIPGNGRHTGFGLEKLDEWLGDEPWDVIHFNWGLHDLAYRSPGVNLDKFKGTVSTSPEDYEKNLEALVVRLKETGARLIWASTTPVPPGEAGRYVGDDTRYNWIAQKVMYRHGVPINDLHATIMKIGYEAFTGPGNVHFKQETSRVLAGEVAESIRAAIAKEVNHPNIVLILVDDMGWTDVGVYGSTYYETPNIDRLAANGMKFTQGYAACAVCSPTRYSILTGKYPTRSGITDWIRPLEGVDWSEEQVRGRPEFQGGPDRQLLTPTNPRWMERDELTIAEVLRSKGYATGFIGKWHLGPKGYWPEDQGFDFNLGGNSYGHPPDYFDPYPPVHQRTTFPNLEPRLKGEYLTDREADEAVAFIQRNRDRPFFLMVAHYAVHSPIQAKDDLIAKYEGKPKTNQKEPVYAAMVESVDEALGSIVEALASEGLLENTLIVFTSDNGGAVHFPATDNAPLRKGKGYPYEGGIREPYIFHWPGHVPAGRVSDQIIMSTDLFPTFAQIAGATGQDSLSIDGIDLSNVITGNGILDREALTWHFPHYWWDTNITPYSIIRDGNMKLIYRYQQDSYELYDLDTDLSEQRDLSASRPSTVKAMKAKLDRMLRSQGAKFPKPDPDFKSGDEQQYYLLGIDSNSERDDSRPVNI
ncbi:MAG: sulfatase-like hydrolase/transferase [Armatimonadetes bacterium]|nr:sulfatase-like hydrolase/transferase [Armatimonadota bacterium]